MQEPLESHLAERARGPHDMGGREAGPVDLAEHAVSFWEWRVDAMVRLLFQAGVLVDFAELRRAIEDMGPAAYDSLGYYERWAGAVAALLVEKGVVSRDELDARVAALKAEAAGKAGT